jgi:hypothetical protein
VKRAECQGVAGVKLERWTVAHCCGSQALKSVDCIPCIRILSSRGMLSLREKERKGYKLVL